MIELPKEIKKTKNKNPKTMIIYGVPKSGKTTALSKLKNCLIVDTESGTEFIDGAYVMQVPENLGEVGKFKWLKELANKIKEEGKPYDYVVIDTLSKLDEWAEWVGTYKYMKSTRGKKFNRKDNNEKNPMWDRSDDNYESVHTLGEGYGYRWSREAILDMVDTLKDLGKICTIFVCHVTDKLVAKTNSSEVMTRDLALTGKVRLILPRDVDAIGNVYNEDGKLMVSFVGSEDKVGGVRAEHLTGYKGELDWDKIFIKE